MAHFIASPFDRTGFVCCLSPILIVKESTTSFNQLKTGDGSAARQLVAPVGSRQTASRSRRLSYVIPYVSYSCFGLCNRTGGISATTHQCFLSYENNYSAWNGKCLRCERPFYAQDVLFVKSPNSVDSFRVSSGQLPSVAVPDPRRAQPTVTSLQIQHISELSATDPAVRTTNTSRMKEFLSWEEGQG